MVAGKVVFITRLENDYLRKKLFFELVSDVAAVTDSIGSQLLGVSLVYYLQSIDGYLSF